MENAVSAWLMQWFHALCFKETAVSTVLVSAELLSATNHLRFCVTCLIFAICIHSLSAVYNKQIVEPLRIPEVQYLPVE